MNREKPDIKACLLIKSIQRECEILRLKLEKYDEALALTQNMQILYEVEKELFALNNQLGPLPGECEQLTSGRWEPSDEVLSSFWGSD